MEDEISLRELIEILIRGKGIIAAITLVAILVSGILSFIVLKPTYEASTTLVVSPLVPKSRLTEKSNAYETIVSLISYLSEFPQMTLEAYGTQVTNPQLLDKVRSELNLDVEKYTLSALQSAIKVVTNKDASTLEIIVKDGDPEMPAVFANSLGQKYIEHISDVINEQMSKTADSLKDHMHEGQANLEKATKELEEFMAKPQGVNELQQDVEAKLALITNFKTDLVKLAIEEKAASASLAKVQENLAKEPMYLELEEPIIANSALAGIAAGQGGGSLSNPGLTIRSQQVNTSYHVLHDMKMELEVKMSGIAAQKAAITTHLQKTLLELEQLQVLLAKDQTEYDRLKQQYTLAQDNYYTFMKKYREAGAATSGKNADIHIMVISPAIVDLKPVAPKKALNLAIAAVLGLMVGVFVVFFMDYWKNSSVPTKTVGGWK